MPQWTPETLKDYREFIEADRHIKDAIERSLTTISERLASAWKNNRCLNCPLAELSALAAATLKFYQENKR
jgi:hypothetical protein